MKYSTLLLFFFVPGLLFAQSGFIQVDQFGYLPSAVKVAVIIDPQVGYNSAQSYTPSSTLEIRESNSNNVIYSDAPTTHNNGAIHTQSGDRGWWFDFSTVTTAGSYYIYDPMTMESSAVFRIHDNVYNPIMKAAGRMFYYNRCNSPKQQPFADANWSDGNSFENPLQDGNCRYIHNPNDASLERELTGGWFDAGDYNKYVTFATFPINDLLWAYIENPQAFGEDWNIPESGNGIPDILDEVKYELDWIFKMTNADGTVHIKMGSIDHNSNTSAPPSDNTDPRYYGPTCTSSSIAVINMFALAASVYKNIPGMSMYADQLESRAMSCWNHIQPYLSSNTLETSCDNGEIVSGDADWSVQEQLDYTLSGAIHLFALNGDPTIHTYIQNNISNTDQLSIEYWSAYRMIVHDALLRYTTLPNQNSTISNTILQSIANAANNNWEGYFGFNEADLYRAFIPDAAYHWGSNLTKSNFANLNQLLVNYSLNTANLPDYNLKVSEQLHYLHGVNPQGMVYLSNMYDYGGDRCADEIYHTWYNDGTDWDHAATSTYGPAPGYLVGGPNKNFSIPTISPPAGQPIQKSYLDFNDGWPNNSWEITEPSIVYQGAYIRLLANYAQNALTTHVQAEVNDECITLYPNPSIQFFTIEGLLGKYTIDVLDIIGNVVDTYTTSESSISIDTDALGAGFYFVRIAHIENNNIVIKTIIKP